MARPPPRSGAFRVSFARLRLALAALERSLWFRPAAFACAALLGLAGSRVVGSLVPDAALERLTAEDMAGLLRVLASSMLAVAIFSLGAMVSAMQAAAASATPRARPLLSADRTAQTAISTFIGAFVFSVLGLAGIALDLFDPAGIAVLFALTMLLIVTVIVALIAWIRRLSNMGGVAEAVALIEAAGSRAFAADAAAPHCGGEGPSVASPGFAPVRAEAFGWVVHIDAAALARVAADRGLVLHVLVRPGAPVHPGRALLGVAGGEPDAEAVAACRVAVVIGPERSFERDPRFALVTLAEIGSRALSPAVNDPGTAMDAIAAQTRLLAGWRRAVAEGGRARACPGVFAPPLAATDLFEDAFRGLARDGAGCVEVAIKLHKALGVLAAADPAAFGAAARAASAEAAARSDAAMPLDADRAAVAACRRAAGLA